MCIRCKKFHIVFFWHVNSSTSFVSPPVGHPYLCCVAGWGWGGVQRVGVPGSFLLQFSIETTSTSTMICKLLYFAKWGVRYCSLKMKGQTNVQYSTKWGARRCTPQNEEQGILYSAKWEASYCTIHRKMRSKVYTEGQQNEEPGTVLIKIRSKLLYSAKWWACILYSAK